MRRFCRADYRYFALPPGDYTVHVRARHTGAAPVEGAPLRFVVVPRWYERRWVVPLLIVLGCAAIAAGLIQRQRRRVRHLREHNIELDRLVHARTQDLERVNLRLQDLADRDGLTGIANRRRFDGFLEECLQRVPVRGRPLGLAMADVDHFKAYNDGHGHQAGDELLRRVARLLADGVRGDTLVARYGGEEFAIVAPDCDLPTMREVAERLRTQVETAALGVTISIGICACDPASPESADALLARADAALYRAKEEGRNRVV
ncbi:MAG: GGDEF domain-containing protein [Proteobacteria bacterium]|nr:GGDEF domain-containing protein [Pseudomonadota bacterium]